MAESEKLFLQHPAGDPTTLPCIHFEPEHDGHIALVPCTHGLVQQHPEGDKVNVLGIGEITVPCVHLQPVHPEGDPVEVPCFDIKPKHPEGDPGPRVPCVHPMPVVREEFNGQLKFYTDSTLIQEATMDAVQRLADAGVQLMHPIRPLHIFHREPLEGGGANDPFWSHYSPFFHSIQVIDEGQADERILDTLRHELGHALLGHTPINHFAGGPHGLTEPAASPALAMSEGWAHFVALILMYSSAESDVAYRGLDWENLSITPDGQVEYCVGAFLWDLFDTLSIRFVETPWGTLGGLPQSDDGAAFTFAELYSVYAPDLVAVANGPWVSSVWDFASRLQQKFEGVLDDVGFIDEILIRNCGARPANLPRYPFASMFMRSSRADQRLSLSGAKKRRLK